MTSAYLSVMVCVGALGTGWRTSQPCSLRKAANAGACDARAWTQTRPPSPAALMRKAAPRSGAVREGEEEPSTVLDEEVKAKRRATSSAMSSTSVKPRSKPPGRSDSSCGRGGGVESVLLCSGCLAPSSDAIHRSMAASLQSFPGEEAQGVAAKKRAEQAGGSTPAAEEKAEVDAAAEEGQATAPAKYSSTDGTSASGSGKR